MSQTVVSTDPGVRHHAHHFDSAEHEFDSAKQGMWLFLVTEVLMIGAIFVAFMTFRGLYLEDFQAAHKLLSVPLGATNTVILITSSVTMVLGVTSAQRKQKGLTVLMLFLTFLLACGFLIVKYIEYTGKFHHGIMPAGLYTGVNEFAASSDAFKLFFSFYFVMTGIHAAHVVIGMGLILWIMRRAARGEFTGGYYTPVELVGFYWHFVDLVWIFLFPMLYLIG